MMVRCPRTSPHAARLSLLINRGDRRLNNYPDRLIRQTVRGDTDSLLKRGDFLSL